MSHPLPVGEIVFKPAIELNAGDILLGDAGGHVPVEDSYRSVDHPGLVTVETHIGYMYLDDNRDHTYKVLVPTLR